MSAKSFRIVKFGVPASFGSHECVRLLWSHRPCAQSPIDQPGRARAWGAGSAGPRLPAGSGWSSPRSLNHNLLFLCSSHVLSPSAQQAKLSVPSWRSLRSSCLSDTPGSENVHICALSGPFPSPAPLLTPPAASKRCIVHIRPHRDLVLTACLL